MSEGNRIGVDNRKLSKSAKRLAKTQKLAELILPALRSEAAALRQKAEERMRQKGGAGGRDNPNE